MASRSRKRGRTSGGEEEGEPVAVAAGFEAPIFGARTVGQVTTLALEGEDGPLASLLLRGHPFYPQTIQVYPAGGTRRDKADDGSGMCKQIVNNDGMRTYKASKTCIRKPSASGCR